jgi:hypothetical protein
MNTQDFLNDHYNTQDKTVNLDYARLYCTYNNQRCDSRTIALGISNYLSARSNYAELADGQEWPCNDTYELSGFGMRFQTRDHQWFSLAGKLAYYGSYMHNDCWIGLAEYRVFEAILEDITDDIEIKDQHNGWRGAGESSFYHDTRFYLCQMQKWFRQAYSDSFPEFLFELVKTKT